MKRLFIICFLVFTLLPIAHIQAATDVSGTYFVNFTWLNVRGGPGLSHAMQDKLDQNEEVKVLQLENGEWYKIQYRGEKNGYVHKKYLTKKKEEEKKPEEEVIIFEEATVIPGEEISDSVPKENMSNKEMGEETDTIPEFENIPPLEESITVEEVTEAENEIIIEIFSKEDTFTNNEPEKSTHEQKGDKSNEYMVDFEWLNIRNGPGLFYDKIGELQRNETIIIERILHDQWAEFSYEGQQGYVYVKYLQKTSEKDVKVTDLIKLMRRVIDLSFLE